jgi:hypothetical protein
MTTTPKRKNLSKVQEDGQKAATERDYMQFVLALNKALKKELNIERKKRDEERKEGEIAKARQQQIQMDLMQENTKLLTRIHFLEHRLQGDAYLSYLSWLGAFLVVIGGTVIPLCEKYFEVALVFSLSVTVLGAVIMLLSFILAFGKNRDLKKE